MLILLSALPLGCAEGVKRGVDDFLHDKPERGNVAMLGLGSGPFRVSHKYRMHTSLIPFQNCTAATATNHPDADAAVTSYARFACPVRLMRDGLPSSRACVRELSHACEDEGVLTIAPRQAQLSLAS